MGRASDSFGEELRGYRRRAGLSQNQLSRRSGVSVRAVRDIEQGHVRRPRPESVRRLAAAVGLPLDGAAIADGSGDALLLEVRPADAQRLRVEVLGPLTVSCGARPVTGPLMQRGLLGLLAVQPNQVVGLDEIIDTLWGEHPQASCRDLVRTYVARLRKVLEPSRAQGEPSRVLATASGGYMLSVGEGELDLLRFGALMDAARNAEAADPAAALELLGQALACWRGPVLTDLPSRLRQHPAALAVSQRQVTATLDFADLAIAHAAHQQATERLQALTAQEPLHEGVHARLMLALAGGGQQAAALEVFTRLRGRLVDELGVEPGAELQDAQARVLRGDLPAPRRTSHSPTVQAAGPPPPAQLPADVVGFTGRAEHLAALGARVGAAGDAATSGMAVTAITGMAGVGKTALAVRWAHQFAGRFPDGQLYVNLRGHAQDPPLEPLQALARLLTGLGVAPERIPVEVDAAAGLYRSLLAGRQVLVILDDAYDAVQVRPLLPGSPGCVVVVTSRDRLTGLVATHGAYRLALDALPPNEAVALLAQVIGNDRVDAEPLAAARLARVCGLLPLALRVAGAHLAGWPEESITGYLAELQAGDRLASLAVDGDPQAAVWVALDASYRHLAADARRLFRLLGLAPGPGVVSVDAAAALGGLRRDAARRLLELLVTAHLVERRGVGRFSMHDLLRLYARERADREDGQPDRDAAFGRLLDWSLHTADTAARLLYPEALRLPVPPAEAPPAGFADAAEAAAWLDAEQASLTAAVRQAAEDGRSSAAWRLADALREHFCLRRSIDEWLGAARAGLAAATAEGDRRAQAACQLSLGQAHLVIGHHEQAIQCYTQAHALAGQAGWTRAQAAALLDLGLAQWWTGNLQQAADYHTQALTLSRQTGWTGGQAIAHLYLGLVQRDKGRLVEAVDHYTQALDFSRTLGSRRWEGYALSALAIVEHDLGRLDRAERHLTQVLCLPWGVENRDGRAIAMYTLAQVHRDTGRHPQALKTARAALILAGEDGFRYPEAAARVVLASVQLRLGHAEQARDHAQTALDVARASGLLRLEVDALLGLAAACQHTGQPTQAVSHARRALDLAVQAGLRVLEGQAHTALAAAQRVMGQHAQTRTHARQASALYRQTGHRPAPAPHPASTHLKSS